MTVSDVLAQMTVVLDSILSMFGSLITTITGNPLIYTPVLVALLGGLIMVAMVIVRKFGVRGRSAGGRRRRR